jgi:hypothetical protein
MEKMMKKTRAIMTMFATMALIGLFGEHSLAGTPTCKTGSQGNPFCKYTGKVEKIYVNHENLILLYLDTAIPESELNKVGYTGVTHRNAVSCKFDDNPDFAKLFYSTALTAQATDRDITIHMHNNFRGFPKVFRIWLAR